MKRKRKRRDNTQFGKVEENHRFQVLYLCCTNGNWNNHDQQGEEEREDMTQDCKKLRFGSSDQLVRHEREKHAKWRYRCFVQLCGARFAQRRELERHITETHRFLPSTVCAECGSSFAPNSARKMLQHAYRRHQSGAYRCSRCCQFVAQTRAAIFSHLRICCHEQRQPELAQTDWRSEKMSPPENQRDKSNFHSAAAFAQTKSQVDSSADQIEVDAPNANDAYARLADDLWIEDAHLDNLIASLILPQSKPSSSSNDSSHEHEQDLQVISEIIKREMATTEHCESNHSCVAKPQSEPYDCGETLHIHKASEMLNFSATDWRENIFGVSPDCPQLEAELDLLSKLIPLYHQQLLSIDSKEVTRIAEHQHVPVDITLAFIEQIRSKALSNEEVQTLRLQISSSINVIVTKLRNHRNHSSPPFSSIILDLLQQCLQTYGEDIELLTDMCREELQRQLTVKLIEFLVIMKINFFAARDGGESYPMFDIFRYCTNLFEQQMLEGQQQFEEEDVLQQMELVAQEDSVCGDIDWLCSVLWDDTSEDSNVTCTLKHTNRAGARWTSRQVSQGPISTSTPTWAMRLLACSRASSSSSSSESSSSASSSSSLSLSSSSSSSSCRQDVRKQCSSRDVRAGKLYQCDQCAQTFAKFHNLLRHRRDEHKAGRGDDCNASTTSRSSTCTTPTIAHARANASLSVARRRALGALESNTELANSPGNEPSNAATTKGNFVKLRNGRHRCPKCEKCFRLKHHCQQHSLYC